MIDWLNSVALTTFGVATTWAEVLGFITGAVCVYLVATQHIWNWPIGILNNIMFIVLFLTFGLYADAGLQVVFIALACYGWYQWAYNKNKVIDALPVSRTNRDQWIVLAGATALGFFLLWYVLENFTGSTVPVADAATTALSLAATWGQCKKKIESWYIWMTADVIYIPLYGYKDLWLTAILYVGFFSLCVYGFISWRKSLLELESQELVPA